MKALNLKKYWALMLVLMVGFTAACEDDPTTPTPTEVDEAQLLVDYVEANRDYDPHSGFITKATDVREAQVADPTSQYLIDIRAADDYAAGHVEGAVNVGLGGLLAHLEGMDDPDQYDRIVLICYSGQSAAYGVGVAKAAGYENVVSMKWGMSSWNPATSGSWVNTVQNGNAFATQMVQGSSPAKNDAGDLPVLSTGFETGAEILAARTADAMVEFGDAKVTAQAVFSAPEDFYIVNYWPQDRYEANHIPTSINYVPDTKPFTLANDLLTLPTDEPVVIYCYTGQTSAYLAGYLRTLGYDARTLLFGANGMFYDTMPGTRFVEADEVHDYPLVN